MAGGRVAEDCVPVEVADAPAMLRHIARELRRQKIALVMIVVLVNLGVMTCWHGQAIFRGRVLSHFGGSRESALMETHIDPSPYADRRTGRIRVPSRRRSFGAHHHRSRRRSTIRRSSRPGSGLRTSGDLRRGRGCRGTPAIAESPGLGSAHAERTLLTGYELGGPVGHRSRRSRRPSRRGGPPRR